MKIIGTRTLSRPSKWNFLFALVFCSWGSSSIAFAALDKTIVTEIFDPGYPQGDCSYHSLTSASDGMLYFTICTHHSEASAHLYRFNPGDQTITLLGILSEILNEDVGLQIPTGKVHTPLIEHNGFLYFATHTSYYTGNLPNMAPEDGRAPYPGGHFMRYHLKTGAFEDLAQLQLASEGIITMAMDPQSETLYGLTWPTGLLISYKLEEGLLRNWGAVQERGEWGRLPAEWNFICRRLGVDEAGKVYGGTDTGRIWRFEAGQQRPVDYLENLNLTQLAPVQESNFEIPPEAHYFWNNWRTIRWNTQTNSFWGIQGGSTQLFEFKPSTGMLRSVRSLRPAGVDPLTRRNPYRSQLGFTLGPKNTLLYLAHAQGEEREGRPGMGTSVRLVTYAIDQEKYQDHGMLVSKDGRRIFFTESIEVGADDHLYTVAWVETIDPVRAEEIRKARTTAAPDETEQAVYEMMLVQLPTWQHFID